MLYGSSVPSFQESKTDPPFTSESLNDRSAFCCGVRAGGGGGDGTGGGGKISGDGGGDATGSGGGATTGSGGGEASGDGSGGLGTGGDVEGSGS